jgi:hypothetical protein
MTAVFAMAPSVVTGLALAAATVVVGEAVASRRDPGCVRG